MTRAAASVRSPQIRLSVPSPGQTLTSVTEQRAQHVRAAVKLLEGAFKVPEISNAFELMFAPRFTALPNEPPEVVGRQAAWALVNVFLAARTAEVLTANGTLSDAEDWFLGDWRGSLPSLASHLPVATAQAATQSLSQIEIDSHFFELLPYILDPYGPGSRLSVIRDPRTLSAREAKRREGAFYTPSDVAQYMVASVLEDQADDCARLTCLDPSCGTGVFLLAQIRAVANVHKDDPGFSKLDYALAHLYGFDLNALAVEACTFVLLQECLPEIRLRGIAPWSAWHALRLNITALDAIRVVLEEDRDANEIAHLRRGILRQLFTQEASKTLPQRFSSVPPHRPMSIGGWLGSNESVISLARICPDVREGFDIVIGNPPYADLGQRKDTSLLRAIYSCLDQDGGAVHVNSYLLFVEMMWRLTRPGRNSSALVVPLSIAYHRGNLYRRCRRAMRLHGGRWRCAFFDREPHALFGEDVKTRNAILLRNEGQDTPRRGQPAELETGPLLKWTSRTRESLFSTINFTPLGQFPFAPGLPKLRGLEQANAFRSLMARTDTLRNFPTRIASYALREVVGVDHRAVVFIGNTAYNFLNVFRSLPDSFCERASLSESNVLGLQFGLEEEAELAFALLSSRFTYWLWRVLGDGFHVSRWFVETIPFGRSSFNSEQAARLQTSGRILWNAVQHHHLVSINRGKRSVAYRPLACESLRDEIDHVLLAAAAIPPSFAVSVLEFVRDTVVVDAHDATRLHLDAYFTEGESCA